MTLSENEMVTATIERHAFPWYYTHLPRKVRRGRSFKDLLALREAEYNRIQKEAGLVETT